MKDLNMESNVIKYLKNILNENFKRVLITN